MDLLFPLDSEAPPIAATGPAANMSLSSIGAVGVMIGVLSANFGFVANNASVAQTQPAQVAQFSFAANNGQGVPGAFETPPAPAATFAIVANLAGVSPTYTATPGPAVITFAGQDGTAAPGAVSETGLLAQFFFAANDAQPHTMASVPGPSAGMTLTANNAGLNFNYIATPSSVGMIFGAQDAVGKGPDQTATPGPALISFFAGDGMLVGASIVHGPNANMTIVANDATFFNLAEGQGHLSTFSTLTGSGQTGVIISNA